MRHSILILVGILAISVSCTNFKEEDASVSLSADLHELSFGWKSTERQLTVSSGSRWYVSMLPSWISLESIDGSTRSPYEWGVNFLAEENDEYNREGTVEIRNETGELIDIAVKQNGAKGKYIALESLEINPALTTIIEGQSQQLSVRYYPTNTSEREVLWTSSNSDVAQVSEAGLLTAKSVGIATITARSEDGVHSAKCLVTVVSKTINVTGISLDKTSLSMTEGDTETLTATVLPSDATDKSVTWSSNNTSVALVSSDGLVTAKAAGTATITVKTNDGSKTASCAVTVNKKVIPVTSVSLNKTSLTMTEGDSETLIATVLPSDATNKSVTWSSNKTSVATVSSSGVVTAKAAGTATITVTTTDGAKTATCGVTVNERPLVTSISVDGMSISDFVGGSYSRTPGIVPSDARYDLEWTVSNPRVVEIQGSGLSVVVHTKDYGKSTVTVSDKLTGISASFDVRTLVSDFKWKENTGSTYSGYPLITIEEGDEYQLHYSCVPSTATHLFEDLSVIVFYENGRIADGPSFISIDENGLIKGLKAGTTGIKPSGRIVCDTSSGQQQRVYITVKSKAIPVSGIVLDKTTLTMAEGDSQTLTATVSPYNATDKSVEWSSNNPSVATVSSSGVVTAKSCGTATITVKTNDGAKTATCSVTVATVAVAGISLNKTSLSLYQNDTETLVATVLPSNASNKSITWASSNTSVATVTSQGVVCAIAAGTATITVKTNDGGKTASCNVQVTADPYGAVDLGLSVKWASFNYGASSVTSTGGYYMWGDPTGSEQPAFFTPPSVNSISGTQYDIVRNNWGGNWRIPTRAEINELYSNCSWTATTLNGVSVLKVTGRNGASIYLPYTGYGMPTDGPIGTITVNDSKNAYMMSAESYGDSYGRFVYVIYFTPSGGRNSASYNASFIKLPIRPVR